MSTEQDQKELPKGGEKGEIKRQKGTTEPATSYIKGYVSGHFRNLIESTAMAARSALCSRYQKKKEIEGSVVTKIKTPRQQENGKGRSGARRCSQGEGLKKPGKGTDSKKGKTKNRMEGQDGPKETRRQEKNKKGKDAMQMKETEREEVKANAGKKLEKRKIKNNASRQG